MKNKNIMDKNSHRSANARLLTPTFGALEVMDEINQVNYEKCMGCGVCVDKCEQGAIALVRDEPNGAPLEICSPIDDAAMT